MENSIESLQNAIKSIKIVEEKRGNNVTEEDMAMRLAISNEQLTKYLNGNISIPYGLVTKLLGFYGIKLKTVEDRIKFDINIPQDDDGTQEKLD